MSTPAAPPANMAATTPQHPANSNASPRTSFLDLPLHVRNTIYHLALPRDEPLELQLSEQNGEKAISASSSSSPPTPPHRLPVALLATTHQINLEALPILYSTNTFTFTSARALITFATMIGSQAREVRPTSHSTAQPSPLYSRDTHCTTRSQILILS